uniref:Uncharacterized protein n=1 Tax=Glossina austeni TaxID=7395 RepID=A0A1A9V1J4_GLOAU
MHAFMVENQAEMNTKNLQKETLAHFWSLVPELRVRPKLANHAPPRRQIAGATATVSTFVTVVGQPNTPTSAGKGGLRRGLPCLPSSDSISAVSSPHIWEIFGKIGLIKKIRISAFPMDLDLILYKDTNRSTSDTQVNAKDPKEVPHAERPELSGISGRTVLTK